MIQCKYKNVGCGINMACKDQEQHDNEKVKEHLMMTKYRLDNAQHELSDTKEQLATALK